MSIAATRIWAGLLLVLPLSAAAAAKDRSGSGPLGKGVAVSNPGVAEASGIAYHPGRGHLFVVGDEGTLAELDGKGALLRTSVVGANVEDVTVHTPSGDLVLLAEVTAELILVDAASLREKGRLRLDVAQIVGQREKGRDGFEGVAFREERGKPGGGVFYLAHQRGPAMLIALAFDPAGGKTVGGEAVLARWKLEGHRDLTAVSWSAALDRLLVVADAEDELLMIDTEGRVRGQVSLPGVQQEGVCLDPAGDLWVADDRAARVVRHAGAQAELAQRVPREGKGKKGKKKGGG